MNTRSSESVKYRRAEDCDWPRDLVLVVLAAAGAAGLHSGNNRRG